MLIFKTNSKEVEEFASALLGTLIVLVTMKLFFLNTINWSEHECWGTHKWVVAVLACPKHGWNRRFSTPYPIVDLSKFSPSIPDRALQLAEFEDIKVRLRSLVPAQLEILPCQSYGPLKSLF